jgi:predicted TIM-barrel fold metal-dependent hydrolase
MKPKRLQIWVSAIWVLLALSCFGFSGHAGNAIPMIDAHSQIDQLVEIEKVIPLLDQAGINRIILTTRGKRKLRDIVDLAKEYPDRVTASIRLKGKAYEKNKPKFKKVLDKRLESSAFGAMAEALIFHAQKGKKAGQVALDLKAPQVQAAFDGAAEKGWPFVVHIEFAASGKRYKKYMKMLEAFLRQNADHPIALIHMGQLKSNEVTRLIDTHPNIYFLAAHANTLAIKKSRQPWINLFSGRKISKRWRALMIEHPDRFVLAFDNVWAEHWGDFYVQQANLWRDALKELPTKVAHAIAHQNAERLWELPPLE